MRIPTLIMGTRLGVSVIEHVYPMQQMLWPNLTAIIFYSDVNEAFSNPAYGEVIGEYIYTITCIKEPMAAQ